MSCCGQRRSHLATSYRRRPAEPSPHPSPRPTVPAPVAPRATVLFEYLGATALSARGPRTGRDYRFAAEGAVVAVDPRDAAALDRVPRLRRLR